MIPKVIHYVWFGGNPLSPLAERCIASWRKFMPDYKLIRWDESNFDTDCCDYVHEAMSAKKWAFASDYARFKILYENGGVYLDTDVELIKSLDPIVEAGPFMGVEANSGLISEDPDVQGPGLAANPGLGLAANPGLGLYKIILDSYENDHFISNMGTYNQMTVVVRVTEILKRLGFEQKPEIQEIAGVKIYPSDYFCPKDFLTNELCITSNTYSIHHFDGTWAGPFTRFKHRVMRAVGPRGITYFKQAKSLFYGGGK